MRRSLKALVLASAVAGGLAVAPLHAEEASPQANPPKSNDMMGGNNMMGGGSGMMGGGSGMMGGNNMGGGDMMNMMTQMMETCNKMMQASMEKDHGNGGKPVTPEKKG